MSGRNRNRTRQDQQQPYDTLLKSLFEGQEEQIVVIGALANKEPLEMLNEKYDKLFDTLIVHD
ncbi:MAG TPA: hypothetical protein VFA10_05105 [Ktedonobacteraceae bacterium]|nr:hypothetical protein [Ktedonobacteraceae bacterium]